MDKEFEDFIELVIEELMVRFGHDEVTSRELFNSFRSGRPKSDDDLMLYEQQYEVANLIQYTQVLKKYTGTVEYLYWRMQFNPYISRKIAEKRRGG